MKVVNDVQGSLELAVPLIVDKTTVYVKKNIRKFESPDTDDLYTWDEYQYDKDEFIMLLNTDKQKLEADLVYVAMMTGVDLNV